MNRLQNRLNADLCDDDSLALIRREEKLRTTLRIVTAIACVAVAAPAAVYALDLDHFSADYNASVISACLWLIPATLICMGICIALVYLEEGSLDRQIGHVKSALAEVGASTPHDEPAKPSRSKLIWGIRVAVAVVAVAFIVLGVCNGGMTDVLSKAINICTECIGLG